MDITNEETIQNNEIITLFIVGLIALITGYMIKYIEDGWQYDVDYVAIGNHVVSKIKDLSISNNHLTNEELVYFLIGACVRNNKLTQEKINAFLTKDNLQYILGNITESKIPMHHSASQHMQKQGFFEKYILEPVHEIQNKIKEEIKK